LIGFGHSLFWLNIDYFLDSGFGKYMMTSFDPLCKNRENLVIRASHQNQYSRPTDPVKLFYESFQFSTYLFAVSLPSISVNLQSGISTS